MPINIERIERLLHAAQDYQNKYDLIRRNAEGILTDRVRDMYAALDSEKRKIAEPFCERFFHLVAYIGEERPSRETDMALFEEMTIQRVNKPNNRKMKLVMQRRRNKIAYGE